MSLINRVLTTALVGCLGATAVEIAAMPVRPARAANPDFLDAFIARYPTSTLPEDTAARTGSACNMCHNTYVFFGDWNCYRADIIARRREGRTVAQSIADVEFLDSDGDGVSNIDEILRPRADLTGHVGYNPGYVGPEGTDPCLSLLIGGVPGPTLPNTGRFETPPRACIADYNRDGLVNTDDLSDYITDYFTLPAATGPGGYAIPGVCEASAPEPFGRLGLKADFNADCLVNTDDLSDYITAYYSGC